MLLKCSKGVSKEWEKWFDNLCEKVCVRLKWKNMLKKMVENYVLNLVR